VFDINDFDETLPRPWKWDVNALVVAEKQSFRRGAPGEFAQAYADQNEHDDQALTDAIRSGRVVAETGP